MCVCVCVCVCVYEVKAKEKFTLEQATKAQRGEQMYSSTLPSTSALDVVAHTHA